MSLCRRWFLLPPLTSDNGVSQSMNMSCLCAPCCVINPPWEPEISPAVSLFFFSRFVLAAQFSFIADTHNKTKYIVSSSVSRSRILPINLRAPFIFIMWLLLVCQAHVLTWYSMHLFAGCLWLFFYLLVGVERFLTWCCGAAVIFSQCLSGLSGSGFK